MNQISWDKEEKEQQEHEAAYAAYEQEEMLARNSKSKLAKEIEEAATAGYRYTRMCEISKTIRQLKAADQSLIRLAKTLGKEEKPVSELDHIFRILIEWMKEEENKIGLRL